MSRARIRLDDGRSLVVCREQRTFLPASAAIYPHVAEGRPRCTIEGQRITTREAQQLLAGVVGALNARYLTTPIASDDVVTS